MVCSSQSGSATCQRGCAAQAAKEPFLELEIERSPATFSSEDDVVIVAATVVAGFCGPLVGGQVVWAAGMYQWIGACA